MRSQEFDLSLGHPAGREPAGLFPAGSQADSLWKFLSRFATPLAVWDLDGRIVRANPAFLRLGGYSMAELEGRSILDLVHPDDRAAAQTTFLELLAAGESFGFESRARCKDGSYRWFLWNAAIVSGEKSIYVAAQDITRWKQAEEAARRSEQWLKFTLGAAGVGLCYRESGETIATEEQFRLYGLEPSEKWISRERWLQSIHPEDRDRVQAEQLVAVEQSEPYVLRFRVVWPDGNVRWLLCRGIVFHDGGVPRKAEITVDLTERRRAEITLEEFFAMCPSGLAILGYDGCVTRANSAWFGVFGFTAEEVHGRPLVEFLHPDDRTAVEKEFQRLIAGGKDAQLECRGLCKNGSSVWLVVSATASPDEKLIFVAGHDITESKRMTEALDLHAEKLARSNEELERFAYVASHDLQEPLRMVASFTELLGKRYSGQLDETADRYIHFAVDGAKRMQQLIADLLAYSRVNSKELDLQQVDCGEAVQTAIRNLEAATLESGASISCDTLPWLPADQMQLTQLFQNLLGNAIKFRRTGEPPRVHVSAVDCGAEYVISVGDNGIGIEPGQVDRIFQVFQRLHTRAEFPGTGIGLAICKKVVERHGGKIWVESTPGIGSTFRFSLPKSQRTG